MDLRVGSNANVIAVVVDAGAMQQGCEFALETCRLTKKPSLDGQSC